LLLKLLYVEDFDIEPSELRLLVRVSQRSVRDVLRGVENLRRMVRERETRLKEGDEALDAVQGWIRLYEAGLCRLRERIDAQRNGGDTRALAQWRLEAAELERKSAWRKRQRASLLARSQRRKVTAPYKEIAALLNISIGTLGSRIKRLRDELARVGMEGLVRGETNDSITSE
jgi:hypothetical protein